MLHVYYYFTSNVYWCGNNSKKNSFKMYLKFNWYYVLYFLNIIYNEILFEGVGIIFFRVYEKQ